MAASYIRNNANIVRGDELWLFIGDSSTTKPICFATTCSLNRSLNTQSVSSKDHGTSSYTIPGEGSWTASTEALMSIATGADGAYAFDKLMELFTAGQKVYVSFGKITNYTGTGIVDVDVTGTSQASGWTLTGSQDNPIWTGQGYMTSLQATGGHGDSATYSVEISGVGPLTRDPAVS